MLLTKNSSVCSLVSHIILGYLFTSHNIIVSAYDFVIIGGGTSGLVIANRLSEIPNITIAVIEAGFSVLNNTNVSSVDGFTLGLNTAIDWQYATTSQTYAGGRILGYNAGKALGGTSTINGMTYVRAALQQIDSWQVGLGNTGWNWSTLYPYYKKSESFTIPTPAQTAAGASYIPAFHGQNGPLKVGYAYDLNNGTLFSQVGRAWESLGVKRSRDINGGNVTGHMVGPSTLDREKNVREDAARAYYYPVQGRPNLHVFLNTTARRIAWAGNLGATYTAGGVEVLNSNGEIEIINATKEVIVSAGSLRSPAILELSGIGNPIILQKYGIPTKIILPGVGENLQDQPNNAFAYESNSTYNGTVPYVTYAPLSSILPSVPAANLSTWASSISAAINGSISPGAMNYLLTIQNDLINQNVPDIEVIFGNTVNTGSGPVQVAIAKWTRKFWAAKALASAFLEMSPGYSVVPKNATDSQWETWIKSTFGSNNHPVGTCSMQGIASGGVVDSNLKVYRTSNVRVVDASILPHQLSGHLTSTLYAVAEKASDIIKNMYGFA
ncbi:putative glucose oxidase protein [Botrytis fragariae]|uniref:Putative glucose oxidase protein n=1 Tax=Botrytis fragariae TaxID=1964551 RepID=A0A8H6B2I6_9HELO|nr:putative glucose oxidase protein [Botrytis fragariae]KAF5877852.1 putative glucose oxidase protein [Botrytis fragariae]